MSIPSVNKHDILSNPGLLGFDILSHDILVTYHRTSWIRCNLPSENQVIHNARKESADLESLIVSTGEFAGFEQRRGTNDVLIGKSNLLHKRPDVGINPVCALLI
jgi:hypothetical protein